jgi:hypothetical protein
MPPTLADEGGARQAGAATGSRRRAPARRSFDRGVMSLAYVAMTVVMLGRWWRWRCITRARGASNAEVLPPDATATYAGSEARADAARRPNRR